jgi:hypothetical protein
MRYLHERGGNNLPGGIESMVTYSFFAQGQSLPQCRTRHDLYVLRNTVFPAGLDLHFQIQDNKESVEGLRSQQRTSLKRLKEANDLPSWDKLVDGGQEMLDKRQEDIDSLLKLTWIKLRRITILPSLTRKGFFCMRIYRNSKPYKCWNYTEDLLSQWTTASS